MSENSNGNESIFNFDQSVQYNINWIRKMAEEHDCSQGLVGTAALMTMLMMDHQSFKNALLDHTDRLKRLEHVLCPSSSVAAPTVA